MEQKQRDPKDKGDKKDIRGFSTWFRVGKFAVRFGAERNLYGLVRPGVRYSVLVVCEFFPFLVRALGME
jgi:hypothetical protein